MLRDCRVTCQTCALFGIDQRRHIVAIVTEVNSEKAFATADYYISEKATQSLSKLLKK